MTLFAKTKTLDTLQHLSPDYEKYKFQLTWAIMNSTHAELTNVIETLVKNYLAKQVYAITSQSPLIKKFCKKTEYAHLWQKRVNNFRKNPALADYVNNDNSDSFDTFLGLFLAREHYEWKKLGLSDDNEAKNLLQEIEKCGLEWQDNSLSHSGICPNKSSAQISCY